jgi:hypothetical protein
VGFVAIALPTTIIAAKPSCGVGFVAIALPTTTIAAKPTLACAFRRNRAERADECDVAHI